jgi:hypothetical protein
MSALRSGEGGLKGEPDLLAELTEVLGRDQVRLIGRDLILELASTSTPDRS